MSRKVKHQNAELFELPVGRKKRDNPLQARNATQQSLIESLCANELTFATGPAGTGKTYVTTRIAAEFLEDREVDRLVITRPMVDCDEEIGFLPGPAEDKFAPYFAPVREVLEDHFGGSHVKALIRSNRIEIAPLAFMRGRSFRNCFVLLDEAQNVTPKQMKMFLTRLGEGSVACVSGDSAQSDLPGRSGLDDAMDRLRHLSEVGFVAFSNDEVVRSDLTRKIVEAYVFK